MDFDFSEEEQAISDLTRQIFEDKVTHEHLRTLENSANYFDKDLWSSLAETGIVGASIHEEYGGAYQFPQYNRITKLVGEFAPRIPARKRCNGSIANPEIWKFEQRRNASQNSFG